MSTDSLSAMVNISPDYCLFAQIRGTDPKQVGLRPLSVYIDNDEPTEWGELCPNTDTID